MIRLHSKGAIRVLLDTVKFVVVYLLLELCFSMAETDELVAVLDYLQGAFPFSLLV